MSKRQSGAGRAAAERIAVDFPQEGEVLDSSGCTFLIDAPARGVEIAIDGDEWRPCRRGDGYWRHDWSRAEPGRHQAIVRCAGRPGGEPTIRVVRFVVARA
jgi:hypothetical protein